MQILFKIYSLLKFCLFSTSKYQLHSPFLYDFYRNILKFDNHSDFVEIESIRKQYLEDTTIIDVIDFGAGSSFNNYRQKPVKQIAKHQLSTPYQLSILYRIAEQYKPKTIIELGTSLGLSSFYLAKPNPSSKVYSLEGNPTLISIAQKNATKLSISNVSYIEGEFDKTLDKVLAKTDQLDLIYIDGNHKKQACYRYLEKIKSYLHPKSIVILDDIYWSQDMANMWQNIANTISYRCKIDIFHFGILIFDEAFKERIEVKIKPEKFL